MRLFGAFRPIRGKFGEFINDRGINKLVLMAGI